VKGDTADKKLRGREELVIAAAMKWYDAHVEDGYGTDELGAQLSILFRRCKALKALKWMKSGRVG